MILSRSCVLHLPHWHLLELGGGAGGLSVPVFPGQYQLNPTIFTSCLVTVTFYSQNFPTLENNLCSYSSWTSALPLDFWSAVCGQFQFQILAVTLIPLKLHLFPTFYFLGRLGCFPTPFHPLQCKGILYLKDLSSLSSKNSTQLSPTSLSHLIFVKPLLLSVPSESDSEFHPLWVLFEAHGSKDEMLLWVRPSSQWYH